MDERIATTDKRASLSKAATTKFSQPHENDDNNK